MAESTETRVPCSRETRERLAASKRGGETYDELFQKMLKQYDPDEAHNPAKRAKA